MTYVYKLYDLGEQLLYVGIAEKLLSRMKQHEATKPWWPDVARIEFIEYTSRATARDVERTHIRTLLPEYNVSDRPSDDEAWEILCDLDTGALEDYLDYEPMHVHLATRNGGTFCATEHRASVERDIDDLLDERRDHPAFVAMRARDIIRGRILASLKQPCDPGCECSMAGAE